MYIVIIIIIIIIIIVIITHADDSRGSKAFIRVCLFVCVCPHDRTKTAETTVAILATGIVHHDSWLPFSIRSKGKRSRLQGHKVKTR